MSKPMAKPSRQQASSDEALSNGSDEDQQQQEQQIDEEDEEELEAVARSASSADDDDATEDAGADVGGDEVLRPFSLCLFLLYLSVPVASNSHLRVLLSRFSFYAGN